MSRWEAVILLRARKLTESTVSSATSSALKKEGGNSSAVAIASSDGVLYEAGTLKQTKRTGWWMAGVRDPESVAEHSWRTALLATIIAKLEGADPAQSAFLAVWHDSQETRTGDVNYLGRKYAPQADPRAVTEDQVTGMPEVLATAVRELVAEYEAKESPEALCARDADKLECMIQGIEYKAQGYENAQRWIDNSRRRLTTKSANELADAVLATESLDWLRAALGETQS